MLQPPPIQHSPSPTNRVLLVIGIGFVWLVTNIASCLVGKEIARVEARLAPEPRPGASSGRVNTTPPALSPKPNTPDGSTTPTAQQEVVETTPAQLIAYFRENPVQAKDWAKNRRISITAPIDIISNNAFGGDSVAIAFRSDASGFMAPTVAFWFSGEFRDQVAQLRKGQQVTVEGTFTEQEFGGDLKFKGEAIR